MKQQTNYWKKRDLLGDRASYKGEDVKPQDKIDWYLKWDRKAYKVLRCNINTLSWITYVTGHGNIKCHLAKWKIEKDRAHIMCEYPTLVCIRLQDHW